MFASQGFAPGTPGMSDGMTVNQSDAMFLASASDSSGEAVPLPTPSPNSTDSAPRQPVAGQVASAEPVAMADTAVDALNRGITQSQAAQPVANLYSAPAAQQQAAVAVAEESAASLSAAPAGQVVAVADPEQVAAMPQVQELAVVAPPKKQSIFARLFAQQPRSAKNAPSGTQKRLVSPKAPQLAMASASSRSDGLPGVRMTATFGGADDEGEGAESGNIQLASAAGLARLAPNGLHLQTERVEVGCFKPELVRVLKTIERHYNRPVVVTSGYRSPKHNRRVGGASGSRHTSCEAADIQIEGVSKWQLAKYLRSMPERGGVGTYCHTESVHIDVGTTRDWNWRCRRRK